MVMKITLNFFFTADLCYCVVNVVLFPINVYLDFSSDVRIYRCLIETSVCDEKCV